MSDRRVVTTARADDDIDRAVAYLIDSASDSVVDGFIQALVEVRDLLRAHPALGSPRFAVETGIPELRGLTLSRYPYVALYTDDPDAIRIHRVLHSSRDIPAELQDL